MVDDAVESAHPMAERHSARASACVDERGRDAIGSRSDFYIKAEVCVAHLNGCVSLISVGNRLTNSLASITCEVKKCLLHLPSPKSSSVLATS